MDIAQKVRILKANKGSTVKLTREGGDEITALITKVTGDGEDAICWFMDVYEGVDRTLSVGEIVEIE